MAANAYFSEILPVNAASSWFAAENGNNVQCWDGTKQCALSQLRRTYS
jgi:hypothetical protein